MQRTALLSMVVIAFLAWIFFPASKSLVAQGTNTTPNEEKKGTEGKKPESEQKPDGDRGTGTPASPTVGETNDRLLRIERHLVELDQRLKTMEGRIRDLAEKEDVKALRDEMNAFRSSVQSMLRSSTSNLGPSEPGLPGTQRPPALATGQILLVNSWNRPVWITLDGIDYLLRPGQTRNIERKPGNFTYEVHDLQGPRTSSLVADGKPHRIEIFPR